MRVQGLSATLTWADGQIVIEHTRAAQHWGAPAVTRVAEASVVGAGWQPPNLIRNGMLQIQVAGVDPQRMQPSDPHTIPRPLRASAAPTHGDGEPARAGKRRRLALVWGRGGCCGSPHRWRPTSPLHRSQPPQ